jgi:hypothetical protein
MESQKHKEKKSLEGRLVQQKKERKTKRKGGRKTTKTFPKACIKSCGKNNITSLLVTLRFQDEGRKKP